MYTHVWNPLSIFNELERTMATTARDWPAFDIEDTNDATTLTADVPGMTENDIELTVENSTLTVHGQRKATEGRYISRFSGVFEKQFRIGEGYDLDNIKAHVLHGVLTISLAKTAKAKPRRIKLGPGTATGVATGVVEKVKNLIAGEPSKQPAA